MINDNTCTCTCTLSLFWCYLVPPSDCSHHLHTNYGENLSLVVLWVVMTRNDRPYSEDGLFLFVFFWYYHTPGCHREHQYTNQMEKCWPLTWVWEPVLSLFINHQYRMCAIVWNKDITMHWWFLWRSVGYYTVSLLCCLSVFLSLSYWTWWIYSILL